MSRNRYQTIKSAYLLFILATVVLVGLRLILKLDFIDPQTGFYSTHSVLSTVFACLYGLFGVLMLVLAYSDAENYEHRALPSLRPVSGAAVLLGASTEFRAVMQGYATYQSIQASTKPVLTVDLLLTLLSLAVSVVAGVVLLMLAVNMGTGRMSGYARSPVLTVMVLYQCFRLIERFTNYISPLTISDDILEILMLVCSILFMMAHARVLARLNVSKGYRLLQFAGYACALTGLLLVLPEVFGILVGRLIYTPERTAGLLYDAALTLYCILFTGRMTK